MGEQSNINTLPIIYNARNKRHESNTNTSPIIYNAWNKQHESNINAVQKNMKTTMKVYLQFKC